MEGGEGRDGGTEQDGNDDVHEHDPARLCACQNGKLNAQRHTARTRRKPAAAPRAATTSRQRS